jgi:hypothetical protein
MVEKEVEEIRRMGTSKKQNEDGANLRESRTGSGRSAEVAEEG